MSASLRDSAKRSAWSWLSGGLNAASIHVPLTNGSGSASRSR
jgi:hypothetical protein